jgi:hypothetical protein
MKTALNINDLIMFDKIVYKFYYEDNQGEDLVFSMPAYNDQLIMLSKKSFDILCANGKINRLEKIGGAYEFRTT